MPLLTADMVSTELQVPLSRVYELARLGLLPHVRIGKQVRFDPDRLKAWIESGGQALPVDVSKAGAVPRSVCR
jgi:excisionase family DNA binding protein